MGTNSEVVVELMIHSLSRNGWASVHPDSWQEVERIADHLAVLAAEVSAYAGARGANGCGDSGHEKAIKAGEKARRKIRKALGYSLS